MKKRASNILKKTAWFLGSFVALIMLLSWLITLPGIQSWLVKRARWAMEYVLQTPVEIKEVDFGLPAHALIKGVLVRDLQQDTLAGVETIRISALNFSVWDYIIRKEAVDQLSVKHIELVRPRLNLYRGMEDTTFNLQFILDLLSSDTPPDSTTKPIGISLEGMDIEGGHITFTDSTRIQGPSLNGKMDFAHLDLVDVHGDFKVHIASNREIELDIDGLRATERISGFQLNRLDLRSISGEPIPGTTVRGQMILDQFSIITPYTHVEGRGRLPKHSLLTLVKHLDDIYAEVWLDKGSRVAVPDITYFSGPIPVNGSFRVDGFFTATEQRITGKQVNISYLDQTRLAANFELLDYLIDADFRLKATLSQSTLQMGEVRQMLPDQGIPASLDSLRLDDVTGTFEGYPEDFQVDMQTETNYGFLNADLHMTLLPRSQLITYAGEVETRNLQLNAMGLSQTTMSNSLTGKGTIQGEGLSFEELNTQLNAYVVRSDIGGYYVDTLATKLTIRDKQLKGELKGSDGKGYADLDFELDAAPENSSIGLGGTIDQIDLQRYGILDTQVISSGQIKLDLSGNSADELLGNIQVQAFSLIRPKDSLALFLPKLRVDFLESPTYEKKIKLRSPLIDVDLSGDFTFQKVIDLGNRLQTEFDLFFQNNDSLINAYHLDYVPDTTAFLLNAGIQCNDSLNHFFEFANIPFNIDPGTILTLNLDTKAQAQDTLLTTGLIELQETSIAYDGIQFQDLHFRSLINILDYRKDIYLNADLEMSRLALTDSFFFDDIVFISEESGNKYSSDLFFIQPNSGGKGKFHTDTRFLTDGSIETVFNLDSSYLAIHGDTLRIDQPNSITFKGSEVEVYNVMLSDPHPKGRPRYYRFDGMVSQDTLDELNFFSSGFDLNTISTFYPVELDLQGIFNLDAAITNLYDAPHISFRARLDSFQLEETKFGDIQAEGMYVSEQEILKLSSGLFRAQDTLGPYQQVDTIMTLKGAVFLGEQGSLDLHVNTPYGLPLFFMTPFAEGELDEFRGQVQIDDFAITGPLAAPKINGIGQFDRSGFIVDYFKTRYSFTGNLLFDNESVQLKQVRIRDSEGHEAQLYGSVRHRGFEDFTFNLQMSSAPNFLVMNTTKKDNNSFYGSIHLNQAIASVTGNLNELNVTAISSFAPGSRLVLPVSEVGDFQKPDFIVFAGADDDSASLKPAQANLSGINMSLTALTNEDLEVELLFDERIGDRIRAQGNGAITLKIDPQGNFTMDGTYVISQGEYLFTSEYLINKLFKVQPGSEITWDGDPYQAQIQIEAYYPLYADVNQLYPSEAENGTNRTLVHVVMRLTGELLKPDVELAIRLPNIDQQSVDQIASLLQSIEDDEQQLNNQIFSLILFNRFVPIGTSTLGDNSAGTAISTGLSELFSSRLNYWISQATNDRLNVGVNAASAQEVNLLLSAKLFNDRVKIERDGVLFNNQAETVLSPQDIIGNVSVEIRLNEPDGTDPSQTKPELVFAVFNRESLQVEGGVQNIYQTGAGLIYKRDFDHISELLSKNKAPKPQSTPDSTNNPPSKR